MIPQLEKYKTLFMNLDFPLKYVKRKALQLMYAVGKN